MEPWLDGSLTEAASSRLVSLKQHKDYTYAHAVFFLQKQVQIENIKETYHMLRIILNFFFFLFLLSKYALNLSP